MNSDYPAEASKLYGMTDAETIRLLGRETHMDVLHKVQNAKVNFGDKKMKLEQRCYLQSVGKIPNYHTQPFSKPIDSEIVESYIDNAILYANAAELLEKRKNFAVIEDDFGPALEDMLTNGKKPSFQNLVDACKKYDTEQAVKVHHKKSQETYKYFTARGVDEDNAQAYAFAIAFYTGSYSWALSMEATAFIRRIIEPTNSEISKVDNNAAMIMYYLIKGLSHVDFYWGSVKRYINLDNKDLDDYKSGEIITWLQFSSSEKGEKSNWFKERNTIFTILSLTGRSIRYFSNCSEEEDEVLFLPHSSFLVCHVDYDEVDKKHLIYLRQIELGLCKYVVLWVDDNIFDKEWENKRHMEKASTLGTRINVHFIPKSTTETALAFLRSEFGQRLKESDTFRIVTDMKRTNESSSSNAGARLIFEVRKLGFNQMCLIFTGHEGKAMENMGKVFGDQRMDGINITKHAIDLEKFVLFK